MKTPKTPAPLPTRLAAFVLALGGRYPHLAWRMQGPSAGACATGSWGPVEAPLARPSA